MVKDARAGRTTRIVARREFWNLIMGVRRQLGVALLVCTVVSVAVLWRWPYWPAGLAVGVIDTALVALVAHMAAVVTKAASVSLGAAGEVDTAKELGKLRRHGWRHVSDVFIVGRGNVDHVVVGPGGVFALETKWTTTTEEETPYQVKVLRDAAAQAVRMSRQVRLRLLDRQWKLRVDVVPVVVLWGGWRHRAGVSTVNGVTVLRGGSLVEWAKSLPPVTPPESGSLALVLDALEVLSLRGDDAHGPSPDSKLVTHGIGHLADRAVVALVAFLLGALFVIAVILGLGSIAGIVVALTSCAASAIVALRARRASNRLEMIATAFASGIAAVCVAIALIFASAAF